jgi:hypothetical protein
MKKKSIYIMAFAAAMALTIPASGRADGNTGDSPSGQNAQKSTTGFSKQTAGMPKIMIEAGRYEFGSAVEGTPVVHDFIVTNRGNAPLIIEEVKTT